MSKLRVLMAALVVVTLFLLPLVAQAQPNVTGFYGDVTLDGNSVADGTVVKAWIDNAVVGSVTTTGSSYQISINGEGQDFSNKKVSFSVGAEDNAVAETGTFVKGAQVALNLTASSTPVTGDPIKITLSPAEGVATNIMGTGAAYNNPVYIYFDGELYTTIKADAEGNFSAILVPTTSEEGSYDVAAIDVMERTATATFTIVPAASGGQGPAGPAGPEGPAGPTGPKGDPGEDGDDGSGSTLAIVALIIAIIAVILAIVFRVMKPAGSQSEA